MHVDDGIKTSWLDCQAANCTSEAMIPELNKLGQHGTEPVHMKPVTGVGSKGDVNFTRGYGTMAI